MSLNSFSEGYLQYLKLQKDTLEQFRHTYNRDTWTGSPEADEYMMTGIERGLSFEVFSGGSGCPISYAGRYDDLKLLHSQGKTISDLDREKQFLQGFQDDYTTKGF